MPVIKTIGVEIAPNAAELSSDYALRLSQSLPAHGKQQQTHPARCRKPAQSGAAQHSERVRVLCSRSTAPHSHSIPAKTQAGSGEEIKGSKKRGEKGRGK